jgi:hypothetical protein
MEPGPIIVISIIIVAVIAALIIAYYQSTSTKVVAAQCDKTKKSVKSRVRRPTLAVIFQRTLIIMFRSHSMVLALAYFTPV